MTSAVSLGARVEDGKIEQGLRAVILEARRAREFGFSPSEFEQVRRRVLAAYEQALAERDKTDSGNYAAEYIRNFTTDEPFPGIQTEYELTRALLPGITQDEVSEVARDLLAKTTARSWSRRRKKPPRRCRPRRRSAGADRRGRRDGGAVEDRPRHARELMPVKPASGHVVSRRTLDSIGVTVLTLSNGVEVWLKPTDFKNDQVLLSAYARGGTSTSPEAELLRHGAQRVAGEPGRRRRHAAARDCLAARRQDGRPLAVHRHERSRRPRRSRPQDLETAFQMLYLTFTAPNGDQAALDLLKRQLNSLIVNRQQNPGAVFADRVRALNTGNSRYVRPITPEALGALKLDVMRQAYRDRFANAADFTFFIVGTFKEADIVAAPRAVRRVAAVDRKADGHSRPLGYRFPASVEKIRGREGTRAEERDRHDVLRRRG